MPRPTLAGFSALVRPRIGALVLAVTAAGYLLERPSTLGPLLPVLLGTLLVASAGCALNHWLERDTDALMERTRRRPLVTGELTAAQVLLGSLAALAAGLVLVGLADATALLLQALAIVLYLGVYTPLKRRTATNTWVGAVPGALPLLVGSAAAGGPSRLAWIAFVLTLVWQLPHFFAIASMYREQYADGGLRMIGRDDPQGVLVGWQVPLWVMSVMLVSILPVLVGAAHGTYGVVALAVGVLFLAAALAFRMRPDRARARRVVLASVVYLPVVLAALVLDVGCSSESGAPGDGGQQAAAHESHVHDGHDGDHEDTVSESPWKTRAAAQAAAEEAAHAAATPGDGAAPTAEDDAGLVFLGGEGFFREGPQDADDGTGLPILTTLPEFELIAEDGKPFRNADMAGRVWVVDFIFTRCGSTCPAQSAVFRKLLEDELPAQFLSVTIDPERDGPAELTGYREKWGGGDEDWRLLTGAPEAIRHLGEGGFRLPVNVAGTESVAGMPPLFHSGKFALVDVAGRVRGYYDYSDKLSIKQLRADVEKLVKAGRAG